MKIGECDPQFSNEEGKCIDTCVSKMFQSERLLRSAIPFRLSAGNLTQEAIVKRLNNPTDSYGQYFTREWIKLMANIN